MRTWKSQDFNGVWTCDLAIPVQCSNQLSYEATVFCSWSFVGSNEPGRNECEMIYIYRIADVKSSKLWSSHGYERNLSNCVYSEVIWMNTKRYIHNRKDHSLLDFTSEVLYMKHFIYHFMSIPHGLIRSHKWPPLIVSGFIAQLVRASHWCCEITGSNPVEVLPFSGFYIRNCLNCVHNCEDHSLLE